MSFAEQKCRYENDPKFRHLADTICSLLVKEQFTVRELRDAIVVARIKAADYQEKRFSLADILGIDPVCEEARSRGEKARAEMCDFCSEKVGTFIRYLGLTEVYICSECIGKQLFALPAVPHLESAQPHFFEVARTYGSKAHLGYKRIGTTEQGEVCYQDSEEKIYVEKEHRYLVLAPLGQIIKPLSESEK